MMGRDRYPLDMPRLAAAMALACALALAGTPLPVAAADLQAKVDEPRAFGHTIGDVLTQRILLAAVDRDLGRVELPSAGRVDVWLERRAARLETDAEGRRWMIVDYQVTNSPRDITRIALPALALKTAAGDVLHVPEWPVSVGPLAPDAGTDAAALRTMQPDRAEPPTALAPIERRLAVMLALLAATLVAWAVWWILRNRREAARLPFAVAWRQMRRLGPSEKESDAAWRALHRALNETGGRVVHAGSLAVLFLRAPWLLPLRPRIEQFYRHSEARFFAVVEAGDETRRSGHAQAKRAVASDAGRNVEAGSSGDISDIGEISDVSDTDNIRDVGDGIGGSRDGASRGLVALSRALFLAERRRHQ